MDQIAVAYFSNKKESLYHLLTTFEKCCETPLKAFGYDDKNEFQQFLQDEGPKEKIQILILDVVNSDQETIQFICDINVISPKTLKLIFSDGIYLLNIHNEFKNEDSFQYLNRSWSEIDFRIVLTSVKHCFSNLQILLNHKSKVSGYSKKVEEQISKQFKKLNESNMAKDKLFSIIAHDLRSPFTALLGITEILINDWTEISDKEKLDLVKGLKSTSENTYKLLEDLLIWSKLQKEKLEAIPESVQIYTIIHSAIENSKSSAYQKQVQIENKIPEEIEVFADKNMMSTVFRNLISNAVKFIQPGGKIQIFSTVEKNFCTFCIADNGDGVSQEHIISHFNQSKNNLTSNDITNFKGLGLLLCKDFIERNGGEIWLETEKGQGSKFYFTVPRR
jgi:two-component system sensor histidine kinase/response regulator